MQPSTNDALPEATDELLDKYRLKFSVMINEIAGGCLVTTHRQDYRGRRHYDLDQSDALTVTSMIKLLLKRVETDKVDLAANDFEVKQLTDRNQVLHQKVSSTDSKLGKLMNRVNGLQAEVDAFQRWKVEHTEKLETFNVDVPDVKQLQEENQRLRDELAKEKAKYLLDEQESLLIVQNLRKQLTALRLTNNELVGDLNRARDIHADQDEAFEMRLQHVSLFVRVLMGVYPEIDIFYVRNLIKQLLDANE